VVGREVGDLPLQKRVVIVSRNGESPRPRPVILVVERHTVAELEVRQRSPPRLLGEEGRQFSLNSSAISMKRWLENGPSKTCIRLPGIHHCTSLRSQSEPARSSPEVIRVGRDRPEARERIVSPVSVEMPEQAGYRRWARG
jgi:hypothetical protein